jgi:hypothetical protein
MGRHLTHSGQDCKRQLEGSGLRLVEEDEMQDARIQDAVCCGSNLPAFTLAVRSASVAFDHASWILHLEIEL